MGGEKREKGKRRWKGEIARKKEGVGGGGERNKNEKKREKGRRNETRDRKREEVNLVKRGTGNGK